MSETESEVKWAFKSQDNAYSVENTLQTIKFKYNTIIFFRNKLFYDLLIISYNM